MRNMWITTLAFVSLTAVGLPLAAEWSPVKPEVDPTFEREFYRAYQQGFEEARETGRDRDEVLADIIEELSALFSMEAVVLNATFIGSGLGEIAPQDKGFEVASALLVYDHITGSKDVCKLFAPYWPSDDLRFQEVLHGDVFGSVVMTEGQPGRFNTDFSSLVGILQESWADGNHNYDGLVDYMFEWNAIMAWLEFLEMKGHDASQLDDHYDTIIVFARPYRNQRARTDPSRVDPQVLDECRALLREFVQGDSLWARVFAAEILNKVSYMRDPEIEAALREDPHWLIQRRMAYLDEAEAKAEQE